MHKRHKDGANNRKQVFSMRPFWCGKWMSFRDEHVIWAPRPSSCRKQQSISLCQVHNKRKRARRHRKLHLASQHCYCWAIDPLKMNSIFCRSLLISNLHCDHICLKNDIIKKMNVLITSPLISPLPGAHPFGLTPRSM